MVEDHLRTGGKAEAGPRFWVAKVAEGGSGNGNRKWANSTAVGRALDERSLIGGIVVEEVSKEAAAAGVGPGEITCWASRFAVGVGSNGEEIGYTHIRDCVFVP